MSHQTQSLAFQGLEPSQKKDNKPRSGGEYSDDSDEAFRENEECGSRELQLSGAHLSGEMRGEKISKDCSSKDSIANLERYKQLQTTQPLEDNIADRRRHSQSQTTNSFVTSEALVNLTACNALQLRKHL